MSTWPRSARSSPRGRRPGNSHLRAAVGPSGHVLDLTPEMLAAARSHGRHTHALLALADARRLPLRTGSIDGGFAAGLLPHLPDPGLGLAELARVIRPGGRLALFHPSGGSPWPHAKGGACATRTCWP